MKHSFTRALTARKVDFMMIITGECSKSGLLRIDKPPEGERKSKRERGREAQSLSLASG